MLRNANTVLLFIEKIDHIFIMTTRNTARLKLPKHKADLFMTQLGWQELLIATKTYLKGMVKVFYLDFFSRKSEIMIACVHGGKQKWGIS